MKIVTDDNIPYAAEAFGKIGDLTALPGRSIDNRAVADADILLVRTLTRVNEKLLSGSRVKFVATATIGFDHIDVEYLKQNSIGFATAAGCNANSVAEYILAAVMHLAGKHGFSLSEKTIGVIGVGNVGSLVAEKAEILGIRTVLNDPPLARETGDPVYKSLDEAIARSDILTLHVPLTHSGEDATYYMAGDDFFSKMKKSAFLINTSRGPVADGTALRRALERGGIAGAVLDVWEGEPDIDVDLLNITDIGTPHIAGYSRDGKANATYLIYRAVCGFLNTAPRWIPKDLPAPAVPLIEAAAGNEPQESVIGKIVQKAYPIMEDDGRLREIKNLNPDLRGHFFDTLRHEYPARREFHSMKVLLKNPNDQLERRLSRLGFSVETG